MSEGLDRDAFMRGYLAEAEEHLAASGRNLLAVESALGRGEPQPRAVRELYRSLHTIKGLSGMVGVDPAVDLAHAMEDVLRAAERAAGRLSSGAVDALSDGLRALDSVVSAVAENRPVPPAPRSVLDALAAQIASVSVGVDATALAGLPPEIVAKLSATETEQIVRGLAGGRSLVRLDFVPSPGRAAEGRTISSVRERVGAVAELVRVIPTAMPRSDAVPAGLVFTLLALTGGDPAELARSAGAGSEVVTVLGPAAPPPSGAESTEPELHEPRAGVVRVEVARLDAALERLSALVVTRMRMLRALSALDASSPSVRTLREIIDESGQQLRDLRQAITQARMVSVAELLERVPLIVRGLGRVTGKAVRVEVDAGRAELDKSVAERIFPAVVHLVRNAVDHAIEPAADRRAAGKPEMGRIRVSCFEIGDGRLELSVSDDGRGVDREAVARRAERPAPQSDQELLDLLSLPGLTTADRVTTTSGRGLGMDIVRRVSADLGGELILATRPGAGSTFTLRVPLSITIIDAFSFTASGQCYVVPVAGVEEIVEIDPRRLARPPRPRSGTLAVQLLERRGEAVPFVHLDALLGLVDDSPRPTAAKAIIVRRATPVAFGVDRMLGHQEVVVRPIDDPLVKVSGVTGATDLGDGRPTLVLDLGALSARLSADRGAPS